MAENVNASSNPGLSREQVSVIVRDPELRKLKPGSEAYQAAFEKKFPKDGTPTSESASDGVGETVKTNKEASSQTDASDDKTNVDGDDALSARAQKRIAALVKERNLEKAERTKLETRIAELEKAGKTPVQAEKQATAEAKADTTGFTKPKPKLSDFKNLEDYNEAYFDWKTDKRDFEVEQKSKTKAAQESSAKTYNEFLEHGKKLEKEMGLNEGDFEALVNDKDGVKTFPSTKQAIIESPFSARIAFELANLDEAEKSRVEKMTAIQQIAYVGRLEAKFEEKKSKTETVSAAKAPGRPLKKGTGGSTATITSGMSYQEYKAARKAQNPEKFRR
jgi:hypothetical protein